MHIDSFATILLVVALPKLAVSISSRDRCTDISTLGPEKAIPWEMARACLTSFPFSLDRAKKTVDSLSATMQLYAFSDEAAHPPLPANIVKPFSAHHLFDIIRKNFTTYANDMDFQEALALSFVPANDGHLTFDPTCYRRLSYRQPFYLMPTLDQGNGSTPNDSTDRFAKIKIHLHAATPLIGASYQAYVGAEIVALDGVPAVTYLSRWADEHVGTYKDPVTRFQQTMSSVMYHQGKWTSVPGRFVHQNSLPPSPSLRWTLRKTDGTLHTLTIPWHITRAPGTIPEAFSSSATYWNAFCHPDALGIDGAGSDAYLHIPSALDQEAGLPRFEPAEEVGEETPPSATHRPDQQGDPARLITLPTVTFDGLALHVLEEKGGMRTSGNRTAVLIIPTLNIKTDAKETWKKNLAWILKSLPSRGITQLIIDLSGNTGGSGCLATEIIAALLPHPGLTFPLLPTRITKQVPLSPLLVNLTIASSRQGKTDSTFHPGRFVDEATARTMSLDDLLLTHRASFGNKTHTDREWPLSPRMSDACSTIEDSPLAAVHVTIPPKNMVVLSDGNCGSACGRILYHLRDAGGIQTIVSGPTSPGVERLASGYPATQVFSLAELLGEMDELGVTAAPHDRHLPFRLPILADLNFSLRPSYRIDRSTKVKSDGSEYPLEYQWIPADETVYWTLGNMGKPNEMWKLVAARMGW